MRFRNQRERETLVRVARLIGQGRMGRACRELARAAHGSPVTLKSDAARIAWANEVLEADRVADQVGFGP